MKLPEPIGWSYLFEDDGSLCQQFDTREEADRWVDSPDCLWSGYVSPLYSEAQVKELLARAEAFEEAAKAVLDATCQDSRQVQTAAEWVRCAAHGAQHDVREIIADMQTAPVQEQQPVFWGEPDAVGNIVDGITTEDKETGHKGWAEKYTVPLYIAQPRKAVKLTPEEIGKAIAAVDRDIYTATKREALISRAIEAAVLKANGVEE